MAIHVQRVFSFFPYTYLKVIEGVVGFVSCVQSFVIGPQCGLYFNVVTLDCHPLNRLVSGLREG